jgi:general secretion pathway protein M
MKSLAFGLPSGPRGRVLAVLFLVLAASLAWFGAIAPLRDFYAGRAETLQLQALQARRMASLAAAVPALTRLAQAQSARTVPIPALQGATDGVAAAALQQKLNDFAAAAGLHIASAETLPAEAAGGWHAISVRLSISGSWAGLTRLLLTIAQSETPMVADDLQLRGPSTFSKDQDSPIEAGFTVTAWREASS